MINRWAAFELLLEFQTLHSSNCNRLEITDFQPSKIKPEMEISLCDATQGNKRVGTIGDCGFLSLFYTLRSSDSHHSRVIIDFQLSITRPEMEMALLWRHPLEKI
jgi:hypothetical protein